MHRTARQADIPGHLKVPTPDTMELVGGDRSSSAPRNIAEGLGRFLPGDFAKFVRTARGSLVETQDHLDAALERGYVRDEQHAEMLRAHRALGACTNFIVYLDKA